MSRSLTVKLTTETLCVLLKEVLDLPPDVQIVGMQGSPIVDEVMLTLESVALEGRSSLPEGVENGWIDYAILRPRPRGRIGRTFLRFRDALDMTRAQASVPDNPLILGGRLEDVSSKGVLDLERKVAPSGPER